MKRIILLACLLSLVGCAKRPVIANLSLMLGDQPTGIYTDGTTAAISGDDLRKLAEIVIYRNKQPIVGLANRIAPQLVIKEKLIAGLQEQGLLLESSSPVSLHFNIDELVVNVIRPNFLYSANAKTHLTLIVKKDGVTLTKSYDRKSNRDTATRPDLDELEKLLNKQLSDVVNKILMDEEVQKFINKR